MFSPIILSQFSTYFSLDNPQSAYIGDSIGGMTAPFFSLLSCILVYAAFKAQIRANQLIQDQFKEQNNDNLFFRLIDSMHNKVSMASLQEFNKEVSGQEGLYALNRQIRNRYIKELKKVGVEYMIEFPQEVNNDIYRELLKCDNGIYINDENVQSFKESFIQRNAFEERFLMSREELIEKYESHSDFHKCLIKLGKDNFYKTFIERRWHVYQTVFEKEHEKHRGFFEGYFNSLKYLLSFIKNNDTDDKNNITHPFYVNFLKENLTSIEKVLIFYYCASTKCDYTTKKLIKKYSILDGLENEIDLFIASTDSSVLKNDINKILS